MLARRLAKEIQEIRNTPNDAVFLFPRENDTSTWDVTMKLSDVKNIRLRVSLPDNYPLKPPTIQLISRLQHPFVCENGKICTDILGPTWSPAMTIEAVMWGVLSILKENPHSGHRQHACCCTRSVSAS